MRKIKRFMVFLLAAVVLGGCGSPSISQEEYNKVVAERDEYKEKYEQLLAENENQKSNSQEDDASEESGEEHIETYGEYLERMERIYSEIKEGAAAVIDRKEIMFNEIPWGTNFISVKEKLSGMGGMVNATPISIGNMIGIRTKIDERLSPFSNAENIGGYAYPPRKEMKVAGYDVDACMLLFLAVEKEGRYILTDEDSALYAAQYKVNPIDCEGAKEDLKEKISSLYGEPDATIDTAKYNVNSENEYIYWYGSNDTVLSLNIDNMGDIIISYVWLGGEELLNAALDSAEKGKSEAEESIHGNGDTNGL